MFFDDVFLGGVCGVFLVGELYLCFGVECVDCYFWVGGVGDFDVVVFEFWVGVGDVLGGVLVDVCGVFVELGVVFVVDFEVVMYLVG